MWGRSDLGIKCSFGSSLDKRWSQDFGWRETSSSLILLVSLRRFPAVEAFVVHPAVKFCVTFYFFFSTGPFAIHTPAHGLRNVFDLGDVSRVPTRPGNDSLPFSAGGVMSSQGRAWGWLRLHWAWRFITETARCMTTCNSQCEDTHWEKCAPNNMGTRLWLWVWGKGTHTPKETEMQIEI